jgi:alkylhydroperoxidase family enzyme
MRHGLTEDLYHRVHEYQSVDDFSTADKLAAEYAERFALDHERLDDDFWDRMRAAFSGQEILELTVTIAFCLGIGRTLAVLDVAHECEVNFTKEPAAVETAAAEGD